MGSPMSVVPVDTGRLSPRKFTCWSGYDTTVSFGQVGVSIYTEPGKMSETFIDHATLIDNIGRQARHDHPIAPAGKSVPGSSINMAPEQLTRQRHVAVIP